MGILGSHASKLRALDFSLRLFVMPFNAATIWITVTTKQDTPTYGTLEFSNLTGLKYMVCISAISAGYSLLAALSSRLRCLVTKPWLFFLTDQITAYLMVTSVAAQGEFLYLAYRGDMAVTWSEACTSYAKVCRRVILGLALHGVAACCFLLLAVISAYRVFKTFEPPVLSDDKEAHHERS